MCCFEIVAMLLLTLISAVLQMGRLQKTWDTRHVLPRLHATVGGMPGKFPVWAARPHMLSSLCVAKQECEPTRWGSPDSDELGPSQVCVHTTGVGCNLFANVTYLEFYHLSPGAKNSRISSLSLQYRKDATHCVGQERLAAWGLFSPVSGCYQSTLALRGAPSGVLITLPTPSCNYSLTEHRVHGRDAAVDGSTGLPSTDRV